MEQGFRPERQALIDDVAEHVRSMQMEYGFQNDADSIPWAIGESADLLGIVLTEAETAAACDLALQLGSEHLRNRA